jgi:prolyl-tRNA synthetase
MDMTYTNVDGKNKNPIMGCYGIGIGRLMASVMEVNCDSYRPIWPISISPWQIHICTLSSKKENIKNEALSIYEELRELKYDVIIDDRNVNAGVQFADADLLGVPVRIIIGPKNLALNKVEICTRDKSIKKLVDRNELIDSIKTIIENLS